MLHAVETYVSVDTPSCIIKIAMSAHSLRSPINAMEKLEQYVPSVQLQGNENDNKSHNHVERDLAVELVCQDGYKDVRFEHDIKNFISPTKLDCKGALSLLALSRTKPISVRILRKGSSFQSIRRKKKKPYMFKANDLDNIYSGSVNFGSARLLEGSNCCVQTTYVGMK